MTPVRLEPVALRNISFWYTVKNMCNFTPNLVADDLPLSVVSPSTALEAMFCPIVLIRTIATAYTALEKCWPEIVI